jgi:hypothetical protein
MWCWITATILDGIIIAAMSYCAWQFWKLFKLIRADFPTL